MIAKRLLAIQKASSPPAPAATDVYYDYRSLILNMQGTAGTATFTDSSPNNFAITPYGNAQLATDATFGTVASFDGTGDYLIAPSSTKFNFGTGDFTVEFWTFPTSGQISTYNPCFYSQNAFDSLAWNANNAGMRIHFGNAIFGGSSFTQINFSTPIPTGQWSHVAVTRSGNTLRVFINGTQVGSAAYTGVIGFDTARPGLSISDSGVSGGREFITGLIGPLRISPWAVYKSNFTPSQDLFPAAPDSIYANPYYDKVALSLKFDGTNGSTSFVDTGPNAFAVTPSGNAQITSASKYGSGAGAFDGNGDYLLAPGANGSFAFGTSPFTIEFWMLANDITSRQGLFSNNINSSSGLNSGPVFAIRGLSTTGKLGVGNVGQADKVQTPENVITVGNWHHIALVREGTGTNQTKIYVDGITQGTGTMSDNYSVARDAGVARTLYYSEYFNGSIDELEITPGVAKYKANFTPPVRGLSTIYNPYTTLPVSGAALWLDGADSSTLFTDAGVTPVNKSGDLVYQWSDKSGNNRHATQATSGNRPTWVPPASGQNGFGALSFNGSSNFFSVLDSALLQFGTGDFTILAVAKVSNASRGATFQNTILSKQYTSLEFSQYQGWMWAYLGGTSNSPNSGSSSVASNVAFSSHLKRESGSTSVGVNGATGTSVTNTTNVSGQGVNLFIGCRNPVNSSLYHQGLIFELALIPRSISSTEIADWYNYCKAKWGTP